jgi:geranylgeranyl pyrophosphate synthase
MKKNRAYKTTKKKLTQHAKIFLEKRGRNAFEFAKEAILSEKIDDKTLLRALEYLVRETWRDVSPFFPALLSISCEAVGGKPEKTTATGAALVIIASAADIHDDIIDQSVTKNSKLTIFGKFGKDVALLVGDALLFKGLMLLHEATNQVAKKRGEAILSLTKQAFFKIGNAEAKEIALKCKYDLQPQEYLNIIRMKAAIYEAHMQIGAIIGSGTSTEIEALGHYGKLLGTLATMRDEFIDLLEPSELRNRVKNECLPLPMFYAFENEKTEAKIIPLLSRNVTENNACEIAETVMNTKEVQKLKKQMKMMVEKEIRKLVFVKDPTIVRELKLLLLATIEDL